MYQDHLTARPSFMWNVRNRRVALALSYAPDWIISISVAALFFWIGNLSGFKREFSLTDISIQHTFATKERVPNFALFLISIVAPLVLMPLINLVQLRSFWDLHNSYLGLLCSVSFAGTLTNIVKVTVGRPRPDLIDRCQPLPGSIDHPVFGLSTYAICTQTSQAIMDDGWKSFFSGHSSLSFAGLGFLSFYLSGKLHLFDKRGHAGKAWLSLIPMAGAALVAISRTMDNRHHWQDVLVGSLVGISFAYFAYRQYYPPLQDPKCHQPYRPRIDRFFGAPQEPVLPHHHDNSLHPLDPVNGYQDDTGDAAEERDRTYDRMNPPEPLLGVNSARDWDENSREGSEDGDHGERTPIVSSIKPAGWSG